jgi:hypothetical protein
LAVFAPLAANADECRRDCPVRPCQTEVRIVYRDTDRGDGFRDHKDRDRDRTERTRFDRDRHDRR